MKFVKMIGLAAMAAMALMVFGAGTASATTLDDGAGNPHPKKIDASLIGGTAKLWNTATTEVLDTCTEGTIEIVEESTGSATETVKGTVAAGDLTWGGCTSTTKTTEGGTLEIHHIANTKNGTVTGTTFTVTVLVGGFLTCNYGLSNTDVMRHVGTLVGSDTTAVIEINTAVVRRPNSSFGCPAEAHWEADYEVTTPTGLTVTAG